MAKFSYQNKCERCKTVFKDAHQLSYCHNCTRRMKELRKEDAKRKIEETKQKELKAFEKKKIRRAPLGYRFEIFEVSQETIGQFVFLENKRKIISHQISSLTRLLHEGKHFDSPLVVNEREDLFHVIDGNHRLTAIKKVLGRDPTYVIDVLLIKYRNLDDDGEIAAFHRWNVGKAQSFDDFLQSVAHKIPFIQWCKKDFPVYTSIYPNAESLRIRVLINALIAAKKADESAMGLQRERFYERLLALREADFLFCKEWVARYAAIFGKPRPKNPYYRTNFFTSCFFIAVQHHDIKDIDRRFREHVLGDQEVLEFSKLTGRIANQRLIELLLQKMRIPKRLVPWAGLPELEVEV